MSNVVLTGRTKPLQPCSLCGEMFHWHKLHLVKGPDASHKGQFCCTDCEQPTKEALTAIAKLEVIFHGLKGKWFFERWQYAGVIKALTLFIYTRTSGPEMAGRIAFRQAVFVCSPTWLVKLMTKIWK